MEEKLFELLFVRSYTYQKVAEELKITLPEIREYYNLNSVTRKEEIKKIRRIRSLYDNKKNIKGYDLGVFIDFYHWYIDQESVQNGKCYYCKADEFKIRELVESGFFGTSKQMKNRGRHLEIERKDSMNNQYSPRNCVLACYFCNNDKSDVITEADYFRYFVNDDPSCREKYIDDKYEELLKRQKNKS
jgi:hypothetical protein